MSHLNGFFPSCFAVMCPFNSTSVVKCDSQRSQLNRVFRCFESLWILRLLFDFDLWLHMPQEYFIWRCFLSLWILTSDLTSPLKSHWSHENRTPSWTTLLCFCTASWPALNSHIVHWYIDHMNRSFVCIQGADAGIFFVTYVTLKGNALMSEFNVFCESSLVLCFIIAGLAINCSVIMFSCEVKIQIILTRCFISTTDAWVENPMMHILLVSFQIGAGLGFQVALVTCI